MKAYSNSKAHKEHLKKLNASKSQIVEVLDTLKNETKLYSSISEAAVAIGVSHSTICNALKASVASQETCKVSAKGVTKPIKKRYVVKRI